MITHGCAMTLTQLEIFIVVAGRRGFTLAAAQLGISQSAVSHAIRALEQELGVELLFSAPGPGRIDGHWGKVAPARSIDARAG